MDISLKFTIVWIVLMIVVMLIFVLVKYRDRIKTVRNFGKLDFVEWYNLNKKEILNKVERRSTLYGLDLEAEIDKEYEAYLQS